MNKIEQDILTDMDISSSERFNIINIKNMNNSLYRDITLSKILDQGLDPELKKVVNSFDNLFLHFKVIQEAGMVFFMYNRETYVDYTIHTNTIHIYNELWDYFYKLTEQYRDEEFEYFLYKYTKDFIMSYINEGNTINLITDEEREMILKNNYE